MALTEIEKEWRKGNELFVMRELIKKHLRYVFILKKRELSNECKIADTNVFLSLIEARNYAQRHYPNKAIRWIRCSERLERSEDLGDYIFFIKRMGRY